MSFFFSQQADNKQRKESAIRTFGNVCKLSQPGPDQDVGKAMHRAIRVRKLAAGFNREESAEVVLVVKRCTVSTEETEMQPVT